MSPSLGCHCVDVCVNSRAGVCGVDKISFQQHTSRMLLLCGEFIGLHYKKNISFFVFLKPPAQKIIHGSVYFSGHNDSFCNGLRR